MIYEYRRGETILVALDAVKGDPAAVSSIVAVLKELPPGGNIPANAPDVAAFAIAARPATAFLASSPAASTTTAGIVELADQTETDAGTDNTRAVTPQGLGSWSGRKQKASNTFGDGSATSFTITHNFNTRNVQVRVWRNSGSFDDIGVDITRPSVNSVTIGPFPTAPGVNAFAYDILA